MSFDEVLFPQDISAGSAFGPQFSTTVSETGAKTERRNQNWTYERNRGDVLYGLKKEADLKTLLDFFRLRRGKARGFRYRDPQDNTVTDDEVMERIASTSGEHDYQIVKRYTDDAGNEYVRKITKPVGVAYPYGQASDTVVVKVDGETKTKDVDYTIDYATGIVVLTSGDDTESAVVTCNCTFDVPMRFDTDHLLESLETYKASKTTVPIIEYEEED